MFSFVFLVIFLFTGAKGNFFRIVRNQLIGQDCNFLSGTHTLVDSDCILPAGTYDLLSLTGKLLKKYVNELNFFKFKMELLCIF